MRIILASILILSSCGDKKKQIVLPELPPIGIGEGTKDELDQLDEDLRREIEAARDPETGWVDPEGCDSMIPNGKLCAIGMDIDITQAEEVVNRGKFHRRPLAYGACWTRENGDNGSETEWSRDQAMAGLFPCALASGNLELVERHATYGQDHDWIMGDPLHDLRAVYWPDIKGILYQIIKTLGGSDNPNRGWPSSYPAGTDDYTAHLQAMSIWIRAAITHSFTVQMIERIDEHIIREPNCPRFRTIRAMYDGNYEPAALILLSRSSDCEYYRQPAEMKTAEELFDIWIIKGGLGDNDI